VASRERKRAERRKRKERGAERTVQLAERREQLASRTEAKNQAAREALEPLAQGERPGVVTAGAIISALIAVSSIVGYLAGVEVTRFGSDGIEQGEDKAPLLSVVSVVVLMGVMAWGMWRARYWAVLGFQALLALVLVGSSLALVQTTDWLRAAFLVALIAGAGALFFFMVKALARIQMPERRTSE
jgi:hypothetical protein